ncbi:hemagglutinin repeat-containing protein (plasmid) [Rhizobium beringeri]|nr:hemagglutinin repeat-containing protein [Rhizobium beringeri]
MNRAGFAGHAEVSHQENSSSSSSSNPVVTDIRTGRSTTLKAQDGSITRDGAQIAAGYDKFGLPTISDDPLAGDIVLSAQNGNISLNAAYFVKQADNAQCPASVGAQRLRTGHQ